MAALQACNGWSRIDTSAMQGFNWAFVQWIAKAIRRQEKIWALSWERLAGRFSIHYLLFASHELCCICLDRKLLVGGNDSYELCSRNWVSCNPKRFLSLCLLQPSECLDERRTMSKSAMERCSSRFEECGYSMKLLRDCRLLEWLACLV